MSKNETALAIVENFNLPAMTGEMSAAFAEEMDGLTMSFDRVKIPSGGGLAFEVPGDDPDSPDMAKELVGVIVDHHPVNAWWEEKYTGANNPPDCSSLDGKFGINVHTGEKRPCSSCPMNQWGSDPEGGNGKACKNMHRVYILREGEAIPVLLTLPPTSLKNLSDYLAKRVVSKGRRSYGVITKVALKKATSSGGITYSQAIFSIGGILGPEVTKAMAEFATSIKPVTRTLAIGQDELVAEVREPGEDADDVPF